MMLEKYPNTEIVKRSFRIDLVRWLLSLARCFEVRIQLFVTSHRLYVQPTPL